MAALTAMTKAKSSGGLGCLYGFFAIFGLFGGGFLLFFLVPAARSLGALDWQAVPCTIVSSNVSEHSGDDSSTYSVDISYRYEVDGRAFTGSRYRFLGGSSSGRSGKQRVVDRLATGSTTTCYVDPDDPGEAVIHRGLDGDYLFALIPGIFVLVGAGGIWFARRQTRGEAAKKAGRSIKPSALARAMAFEQGAKLEPRFGPGARLLGHLLIAAIWNGITGGALWAVLSSDEKPGCALAFLAVFALIGALLLASLPYQFLKLFNPRPTLTLDRAGIPLGGMVTLSWSFRGAVRRIARLKIVLEGREEASYRQGTDTKTDTALFARILLIDTEDPIAVHHGRTTVTLPGDTMHSFEAEHNKVRWAFKLHGDIPSWPDVEEEIPVTVLAKEPYA